MTELDKLNPLDEPRVALRQGKNLGVVADCVPNGCFKQQVFPFRWKT